MLKREGGAMVEVRYKCHVPFLFVFNNLIYFVFVHFLTCVVCMYIVLYYSCIYYVPWGLSEGKPRVIKPL